MVKLSTKNTENNQTNQTVDNTPPNQVTPIEWDDPKTAAFTHDYMKEEIDRFDLNMSSESCVKCNGTLDHFTDPRALYDKIADQNIKWIQSPHADMNNVYSDITLPIYDVRNLKSTNDPKRPKGHIEIKRLSEHINDHGEFSKIAKAATRSILTNLSK